MNRLRQLMESRTLTALLLIGLIVLQIWTWRIQRERLAVAREYLAETQESNERLTWLAGYLAASPGERVEISTKLEKSLARSH